MQVLGDPSPYFLFLFGTMLFMLLTVLSHRGGFIQRFKNQRYKCLFESTLLNMWFYFPMSSLPLMISDHYHWLSVLILFVGPYLSLKYYKRQLKIKQTPLFLAPWLDDFLVPNSKDIT